jgi:putative ABC transport system permease protein
MGSIIANELGLEAGSQVTFVIGNTTTTAKVAGITGEFLDDSILMTLPQADTVLLSQGKVNAVITEQGGMSRDALESSLRSQLPIASVAYTQDVIDGMTSMLEGITVMFYIFIGFGVVSEVLFVSTTVVLSILEREGEFVSLRAIGTKPGKIRRMIVLESVILLAGGLLIGLPLGAFVTIRGLAYIVGNLMYYTITIPPSVYVLTTAIAVVSALLAAFISSNHIRKIDLADAIRQRQSA